MNKLKKHYSGETFGDANLWFVLGRRENIGLMKEHQINQNSDIEEKLELLVSRGKLKTIIEPTGTEPVVNQSRCEILTLTFTPLVGMSFLLTIS